MREREGQRWWSRTGTRSALSTIFLIVGTVLFRGGVLAGSAYDTIYSSDRFVGTAVEAIQHPAVRAEISNELTNQVIAQRPDLVAGRPLIQSVVDPVIASPPFQKILIVALSHIHDTFFSADKPSLVLDLSDRVQIIRGGLKAYDTNLSAEVPDSIQAGLIKLSGRPYAARIVEIGMTIERVVLVLGMVGALLLIAAVAVAANRRRAMLGIGIAFALGALVIWLALGIGRQVLVARFNDLASEEAVAAVYDTFLAELRNWVKVLGIVGVVLAVASTATLRVAIPRA